MKHFEKCPNPNCPTNKSQAINFIVWDDGKKFYIKKGYYKTKHNHQPVPRYQCKHCKVTFSTHTFRETKNQKKPHINEQAFKLISSGVTLRRAAKILGVAKKTIERKFEFISRLAKEAHEEFLKKEVNKTSYVQFDEMETYEHTKCKPLSISLAVRAKNGDIIDAQVALMRCKGKLAPISRAKYPYWNRDNRNSTTQRVMRSVKKVSKKFITVACDAKRVYPSLVQKIIPNAEVLQFASRKSMIKDDPLFRLNHTAAKVRADLSRMRRKTWATTKRLENLQKHLYIYIAWNNKYSIGWNYS